MRSLKGWPTRHKACFQILILLSLVIISVGLNDWVNDGYYCNSNHYRYKLQGLSAASILQPFSSVSNQYVNHSPIIIDGNADFITQASVKNWSGNGTASAPYVIDGYNITGPSESNLIEIANTDVHFQISNCLLSGGQCGIYLNKVINGQVFNDTIVHNNLYNVQGILCSNLLISHNIIDNFYTGINLVDSGDCIITNNTVVNHSAYGIGLSRSWNITISNNTVTNISSYGIFLFSSENNTIIRNYIANNTGHGVYLRNPGVTIFKIKNVNNRVLFNFFSGNNELGAQAYDEGLNNTFEFNLWDDWISPDSDEDGFVDAPYSIDGPANNQDLFPLVTPNMDFIIGLRVIYPTGGEILTGSVTIQWTTGIDSLGHAVTYTVYYSEDNGTNWTMIATGLSSTNYAWDTTTVVTGTSCLIKVVARCSEGTIKEANTNTPFTVHNLSPLKIMFPKGGELLNNIVIIRWEDITDSLGHNVSYTLYYSSDQGVTWEILEEEVKITTYRWNTSLVEDYTTYQIKIVASCSENLTTEVKSATFTVHNDLSQPTVHVPTANTTLSGIVTIRWNASVDALGHEVIYSLYYSSDEGDNWVLFASDVTTPNYTWNTFTVPDGNHYQIKVVATCSMGLTTEAVSDGLFAIHNVGIYIWISASLVLIIIFVAVVVRSVSTIYSVKNNSQ